MSFIVFSVVIAFFAGFCTGVGLMILCNFINEDER